MALFSSEYKKTFEQIIQPIAQVIKDLETHISKNEESNLAKSRQADELVKQASEHRIESERAAAAKAKFEALIS